MTVPGADPALDPVVAASADKEFTAELREWLDHPHLSARDRHLASTARAWLEMTGRWT